MDYLSGLLQLSPLGLVIVTFIMCQLTVAAVTLYLHRDQSHRGLELHPAVRHFCRFWLWLTTGINTREWVAIHRKHHAHCETKDDPHSPQAHGLRKVLFQGAELYREEAKNQETLEVYGRGTPDDWMERNLYTRHSYLGIVILFATNIILFGPIGITIGAIQMATIPFLAAGIINGIGHHTGYRNFECDDAATNVVPWGVFLGGEELHNNHHAFPTSSKFSVRRWEFDIGWLYVTVLRFFGLVKVRKVAPVPVLEPEHSSVDLDTLKAVLVNRMHVLRDYTRSVTVPTLRAEIADLPQRLGRGARRLMVRQPKLLDEASKSRLSELLERNQSLRTVHEYRERLRALWSSRNISNEKLLAQLREWVAQAEASGIRALEEFSGRLRSYQMA
ncbi:MAG: fatty acid desaturase [Gammaproteobacteria bacterium]|nr:fatty acid desaturase [Gammaproteobacteria bacterium]